MCAVFRRKPHRKAILRTDSARVAGEELEERATARSTRIKRDVAEHRARADARGYVVGVASAYWLVEEEQHFAAPHAEPFTFTHQCVVSGVVTTDNPDEESLLAVGDRVEYARLEEEGKGVVIHVCQRKTRLFRQTVDRRSLQVLAANVDRAFFVHAVTEPYFSRRLLDRQLVAAEQGEVEPVIVFNKIDLGIPDEVQAAIEFYRDRLGIRTCLTSAVTGVGIDELRSLLEGVICVLIGQSGVGKSALLNKCVGADLQAVRAISAKHHRGRHTTTNARLFHFPNGGALIDTPGVKEFGLAQIAPEDLAFYFHDFDPYYPQCKYLPCTHTHEPECAVRAAVERGDILPERYESYLRIFESLQEV